MDKELSLHILAILIFSITIGGNLCVWIPYYKRRKLYKTDLKAGESRERMKFITKYSPDEVVWKLRCHGVGDVFEYEIKKESDAVFLLIIDRIKKLFNYSQGEVRYKIVIKQEGEYTAIWVFLLECRNEYSKDRFGWEMKGFLIKKLDAENVEFDLGRKEPEQ